uniref:Ion_trans_2 domain-containing protein n=1 Tax=Macrostomum lignano TaxID=282301 RepID=A0A1I8FMA4_9PLAT
IGYSAIMMNSTDGSCESNSRSARCRGFIDQLAEQRWLRGSAYLLLYFLLFMPSLAMLFMAIEGRLDFLANHTCLSDAELERFLAIVLATNNRGVSALRNASQGRSNWSFGQSLFLRHHRGHHHRYGRTAPLSHLGKGHSRAALLHLCLIFTCLLVCFLLIPAAAFAQLERDWTYLDAFYYCVISLTTVGLGDFIVGEHPDQENRLLYKIFAVVYLYVGLIFLVFALRSFADLPDLNPGRFIYSEDLDALIDSDRYDVSTGCSGGGSEGSQTAVAVEPGFSNGIWRQRRTARLRLDRAGLRPDDVASQSKSSALIAPRAAGQRAASGKFFMAACAASSCLSKAFIRAGLSVLYNSYGTFTGYGYGYGYG